MITISDNTASNMIFDII
ncbi:MAG: hypothetical protein V7L26_00075 [Nostoc sp.]